MELAIIGMLFVFGGLMLAILLLGMLVGSVDVEQGLDERPPELEPPRSEEERAHASERA